MKQFKVLSLQHKHAQNEDLHVILNNDSVLIVYII